MSHCLNLCSSLITSEANVSTPLHKHLSELLTHKKTAFSCSLSHKGVTTAGSSSYLIWQSFTSEIFSYTILPIANAFSLKLQLQKMSLGKLLETTNMMIKRKQSATTKLSVFPVFVYLNFHFL